MKNTACITGAVLCLLAVPAAAQDIIVKQNADELKARVTEITETHVKYRNHSNPSGPVYSIPKSEVFVIRYENGSRETFAGETAAAEPQTADMSAPEKYAGINRALTETRKREQLHKRHMEYSVDGTFGYAFSSHMAGITYSAGVAGEYYPSLKSAYGLGLGLSVAGASYEFSAPLNGSDPLKLTQMNIDLLGTMHNRRFSASGGVRIALPLAAKISSVDVSDGIATTIGIVGEAAWTPGHLILGGGLCFTMNSLLKDVADNYKQAPLGFHLLVGFRF